MERLYQKVSQKYFTKLLHSTIKGEAIQLEILTKNDVTKCCFCQFVVISGTVKQVWKLLECKFEKCPDIWERTDWFFPFKNRQMSTPFAENNKTLTTIYRQAACRS